MGRQLFGAQIHIFYTHINFTKTFLERANVKKLFLIFCTLCSAHVYSMFDKEQVLLSAAMTDNNPKALACLQQSASPLCQDSNGNDPLRIAVARNNYDLAKILLDYGAQPDSINSFGESTWDLVVKEQKSAILELFIQEGAQQKTYSHVFLAASMGHADMLQLLIEKAKIPLKEPYRGSGISLGTSLLHTAIEHARQSVIDQLLAYDVDFNSVSPTSEAPLSNAVSHGLIAIVRTLLARNAAVDQRFDEKKPTPLYRAVLNRQDDIIALLLSHQADPNAVNDRLLTTILHTAVGNRDGRVLQELLDHGGNMYTPGYDGKSILHAAVAETECLDIARMLVIKHKFDVNYAAQGDITPLHEACHAGNLGAVELLLQHGASVHKKNAFGRTPLHDAASRGVLPVVELLLMRNADKDLADKAGETPLFKAVDAGSFPVVDYLLGAGADPSKSTLAEVSPLHHATYGGHVDIVSSLLAHGAIVNKQNIWGKTPLHDVTHSRNETIARLLLQHGADADIQDCSGVTPPELGTMVGCEVLRQAVLGMYARPGLSQCKKK